MEYPRCKTCKWWTEDPVTYIDRDNGYRKVETGRRECKSPAYVEPAKVDIYSIGITDPRHVECFGSGGWAGIAPGPEHGCIHHEPNESQLCKK